MKCGNNIMRLKEYVPILLTVSFVLFFFSGVNAEVDGECSNCHTMHNSQDGTAVVYALNSGYSGYNTVEEPINYLLITDCAGCHSSTDTVTIEVGDDDTPIIFNTSTFNNPLAGGNFSYVRNDDAMGHNVDLFADQDATLGLTPPGGSIMSRRLTCAGEYGCHGDRSAGKTNYTAMGGAHHKDDTGGITGASLGLSYRFLNGILGTEDNDWEQETAVDHNQYKGSTSNDTETISYLCSRCHGDFHTWTGGVSEVGTDSPWLRHPTDVVLPATGEFAGYTSYNAIAPVAQTSPGLTTNDTVVPGSDTVMCLSCHRAHSSPYYKMLRWDTKGTLADALSGCNVCHTSKN
jgi:predicted CXXCH cytochrome family protein